MLCADIFKRFCEILQLKEASYKPILHNVATITFFCMAAKYRDSI